MSQVTIINKNETYIQVNSTDDILYELADQFTFMVPGSQFSPKFRARLWDGRIRLFNLRNGELYRGLAQHVIKYCESNGYSVNYEDTTNEFSIKEAEAFIEALKLPVEPYDYQKSGFLYGIRDKRALLLSPTASGKSLLIYLIHRFLALSGLKGIVIVPTTSLVEQLTSDFKEYSENNGYNVEAAVHKIYSGQDKNTDKPLSISTWQSLQDMPKNFFHQFDYVIGDEAHGFKAKSLTYIMTNMVKSKYRIGTTGTLDGSKVNKLVLEGLFGPERKLVSTKQLMDHGRVADLTIKCLMLKHPEVYCKAAKNFKYQDEIKYLVLSESRNNFIKNLTLSLPDNTLVLFNYIEHGEILYEKINQERGNRSVHFVYGKTDVDVREDVRRLVDTHITNNEILLEFGDIKIRCLKDDLVKLTDGSCKKAMYITEDDDVENEWILNRK